MIYKIKIYKIKTRKTQTHNKTQTSIKINKPYNIQ